MIDGILIWTSATFEAILTFREDLAGPRAGNEKDVATARADYG